MKNKYSSFFNKDIPEPEPESSGERIYPALRNMESTMLQRLSNDRDRSDQRTKELERITRVSITSDQEARDNDAIKSGM